MGSGSLAAMAVFESSWTPKMSRQAAIDIVCEAIEAGIWNDLGSGSNVDVCVIEPQGTEMLRNYKTPNEKVKKEKSYKWRRCVSFLSLSLFPSLLFFSVIQATIPADGYFIRFPTTGESPLGPKRRSSTL